jgi:hypothetical protein
LERKATVGEVFDSTVVIKFYGLLRYGMLLRLIDDSLKKVRNSTLIECKETVKNEFESLYQEFEEKAKYSVIPIRRLVSVQLGSALHVAEYLKKRVC